MIQEAYCSFEVANLLKEKGFDERTWTCYIEHEISHYDYNFSNSELIDVAISAPTHQMAMAWLREVHNIHVVPMIENNGNYISYLYDTKGNNVQGWDRRLSKTSYEEAVEAALKYVLENLI